MPHHKEKYYLELNHIEKIHVKIWKYCVIDRTYAQISKYIDLSIRQTKEHVSMMVENGMVEVILNPGKPSIIRRLNLVKPID